MDKNSIFGIILIAAIFIVWGVLNKPDQEKLKKIQQRNDSIALVQKKQEQEKEIKAIEAKQGIVNTIAKDTIKAEQLKQEYGVFSNEVNGDNKIYTLENDLIKFKISQKGGRPYSVELKKYKTYDSLPVVLFDGDSSLFGINFYSQNRHINTNDLYFNSSLSDNLSIVTTDSKTISMRLNAGENGYIEYRYTLQPDKYQVDLEIELNGLKDISTQRNGFIDLDWMIYLPQQEKGRDNEINYTTLYYKPN